MSGDLASKISGVEIKTKHLWLLGFVVALVFAYFAQKSTNDAARAHDRATVALICRKSSERDAYAANGLRQIALRVRERAEAGDEKAAQTYEAAAFAIARALARPDGLKDFKQMIDVDTITAPDGKITFELTPQAEELQAEGCARAAEHT